eukprot:TCONS_00012080-protein
MKVLRKFSRGNLKIDETLCPPSTPKIDEGGMQTTPETVTVLPKSRRKSSTVLQPPNLVASVLTKTRRKSSTTAMHRGSVSILVIGDEAIGKTTMCRTFTQQDMKSNDFCARGVSGERRFSTPMILPPINNNVGLSHYDIRISVVCTEWCRKNVRAYRDLLLSSDGFILAYRKSKRESFISLIEVSSDIKRSRPQNNAPVIVASLKNETNEPYNLRNEDLVVLQEENFEIDLRKLECTEQMFRTLVNKCIQSNCKT